VGEEFPLECPNWGELVRAHDDRDAIQASPAEMPVIDTHSL
jgi:hypothetical protein